MIIFIPVYIYFIFLTIIASIVSLLSSITLKDQIAEELRNKIKIIEAEEMELKKAKKQLNAPTKALSSSSHKKKESSSDPQK